MRFIVLSLISAVALSACGKKETSTNDAGGNCTALYMADHNRVKTNLDFVNSSCGTSPFSELCRQDKVAANNACNAYQAQHKPGRTCSAMTAANVKADFHTSDVHGACNAFRARYGIN